MYIQVVNSNGNIYDKRLVKKTGLTECIFQKQLFFHFFRFEDLYRGGGGGCSALDHGAWWPCLPSVRFVVRAP